MLEKPARSLALVILSVIILTFSSPVAAGGKQPRTTKLKVGAVPYLSYGPFYIAEAEGYFAEEGIEVEFLRLKGSGRMVALAQGDLDAAETLLRASSLNFMARDARVRIVADKGYLARGGCPSAAIVAGKERVISGRLEDPSDIKGLLVAMEETSLEGYYMEKLLGRSGLSLEDIVLVDIPSPASELEALGKGSLDLVTYSEPWVTRAVESGYGVIWKSAGEIIPDAQYSFVMFGPSLLFEDPGLGKSFMVAYLKGIRQFNMGKTDRNLEILEKVTGLDRDLLKKSCWPAMGSNGRINLEAVLEFQAWAVTRGFMDTPLRGDRIWDSRFVDYGARVLAGWAP